MNTSTIVAIVVVVVVLVVAVLALRPLLRRRRLQARFGPEYDRAVQGSDNRAVAERELVERERQYERLELRPLDPQSRDRYLQQWAAVQARFVDAPEAAVAAADELMTQLMAERGYPTEGYEEKLAVLSVEHASTLERYREAHEIQRRASGGAVPTEDLRNAVVHYRSLFTELLGPHDAEDRPGAAGVEHDRSGRRTEPDTGNGDAIRYERGSHPDRGYDGGDHAELDDAERGRAGRHHTAR